MARRQHRSVKLDLRSRAPTSSCTAGPGRMQTVNRHVPTLSPAWTSRHRWGPSPASYARGRVFFICSRPYTNFSSPVRNLRARIVRPDIESIYSREPKLRSLIRFIVLLNLLYGHFFLANINCYDFPLQRAGCHLVFFSSLTSSKHTLI
jgi:hypothetical protein